MALNENKKSFILHCDLFYSISHLPREIKGDLFQTILEYVNDLNPQPQDILVKTAFEPIKQSLKRELKKWRGKAQAGRLGGIRSGEVRREKKKSKQNDSASFLLREKTGFASASASHKSIENQSEQEAKGSKRTVSVSVSDSVSGNNRDSLIIADNNQIFTIEHCLTVALNDERWVRANKTNKKELEQFNQALTEMGEYNKNPALYKRHFSSWKKKGYLDPQKRPNNGNWAEKSSAAPLRDL